jgi:hypothetical protein
VTSNAASSPTGSTSTALLTDHYELTMLRAALESGAASLPSVFEVFARSLPEGRRYGVVGGTGRFLDALEQFRFGEPEIAALREHGIVDDATARRLPLHRVHHRPGRGRGLLPGHAGTRRRGQLRRVRRAGDAGPLDPQPRLGDRLGGCPDDLRRR